MKYLLILCCLFTTVVVSAQLPVKNELYKKIEIYYSQNPSPVEYVYQIHKNALGYDTSRSSFAYVSLNDKSGMIVWPDSNYIISSGLLAAEDNYFLDASRIEKIKIKEKELRTTPYTALDYIPGYNRRNLEKAFGVIKSFNRIKGIYQVLTTKYLLKVDTLTFKINSLHRYDMFEGKVQYTEYRYLPLPDSIQNFIKQQAVGLIDASKNFSNTTFKEIQKKEIPVTSFEGKSFDFKNLVSFNKGLLDSSMKNKYVIFDFFYQTCYPCHQMTKWILEWMPAIDTSKIMLIGIDPTDAEPSMNLFIKDKKIDYPIIISQQAKDIVHHYHVRVYPTLFLLSPEGTIRIIHEGMSNHFLTKAEKIVNRQR